MNPAQYRAMEIRHKNDLMHHGIDGQKWGVKHGPPYPLDDSKSTGSRLKTKKKKKRQVDPGLEEAIKRGGRFGLIGATAAAIKYNKNKKKKASSNENPKNEPKTASKSQKINKAKNEDKWDMEFLERYQPAEWDQAKALKEYEKYLENPQNYHGH